MKGVVVDKRSSGQEKTLNKENGHRESVPDSKGCGDLWEQNTVRYNNFCLWLDDEGGGLHIKGKLVPYSCSCGEFTYWHVCLCIKSQEKLHIGSI